MKFSFEFVKSVPQNMDESVLYISVHYSTAIHLCPCGCGSEIVTKLSPDRWSLTYDGESVSLYPSVGNWGLPCRSHYWIKRNEIAWAESWTDEEVIQERKKDKRRRSWFFNKWFN